MEKDQIMEQNASVSVGVRPDIAPSLGFPVREKNVLDILLSETWVNDLEWTYDQTVGKNVVYTYDYYGVTSVGTPDACDCEEYDHTGCARRWEAGKVCVKNCLPEQAAALMRKPGVDVTIPGLSGTNAQQQREMMTQQYIMKICNGILKGDPTASAPGVPAMDSFASIFTPLNGVTVIDNDLSYNIEGAFMALWGKLRRKTCSTTNLLNGYWFTTPEVEQWLMRKSGMPTSSGMIRMVGNTVTVMNVPVVSDCGFVTDTDVGGRLYTDIYYAPAGHLGVPLLNPFNDPIVKTWDAEAIAGDNPPAAACDKLCEKMVNYGTMIARNLFELGRITRVPVPYGVTISSEMDQAMNPILSGVALN